MKQGPGVGDLILLIVPDLYEVESRILEAAFKVDYVSLLKSQNARPDAYLLCLSIIASSRGPVVLQEDLVGARQLGGGGVGRVADGRIQHAQEPKRRKSAFRSSIENAMVKRINNIQCLGFFFKLTR